MRIPYTCILFGVGQTGQCAARLLRRRGALIIAAYSRHSHIGADLGVLSEGLASGLDVRAVHPQEPLPAGVDVALFCTTGRPDDLLDQAQRCLSAGINVITLAEGAFYPWTYAPQVAGQLHAAALRGRATLLASGFQDSIMLHLVAALSASSVSPDAIDMHVYSDFSRLGAGSARRMQLGSAVDDFDAQVSKTHDAGPPMSTSGQVIEALASRLGVGAPVMEYQLSPVVARSDLYSAQLETVLAAGSVSGMEETVTGRTPSGMILTCRLTARLFEPEDQEFFTCVIRGPTPLELRVSPLHSLEATVATMINRIPQIIAAAPGFVSADQLPSPHHQS